MARTVTATQSTLANQTTRRPDRSERLLRRTGAWILLYLGLQAELGLAWDRNWHDLIGRDQFWTLPHMMLYAGVGGAGLVALLVGIIDTIRYHRRAAGVNDSSTITFLRYFHAPLGYILLGFGALTDLVAAPLDNYWHLLYGIDVTLWSPFHLMGTIGGTLEGLGIIYIFSSEIVIERDSPQSPRRWLGFSALEWGVLALLAAYINLAIPALTAFIPISLGPIQLLSYPIPLALTAGFSLVSAVQITRKAGSASLTVLLLFIEAFYTQAFVPFAIRTSVNMLHLTYRFVDRRPAFNFTLVLLPLLFLVIALTIDWLVYRKQKSGANTTILPPLWQLMLIVTIPALALPPLIVQTVESIPAFSPVPAGMFVLEPQWFSTLLSAPLVLLFGTIGVLFGLFFGDIWYMNRQ